MAIAALFVGITTNAQIVSKVTPFGQFGISSGVNKIVNIDGELGAQAGRNRVSIIAQSFDSNPNSYRKYSLGVKYLRLFPLVTNVQGTLSLAGRTRTDNTALYVLEPGAGFNIDFNKDLSLLVGITSPITQVSFTNKYTTLAGNLGLKFNL